jgi:predicted transcriptional regulator
MARTLTRVSQSNRDRIDIIASILDAANGGASRRRILLISGLSNNQFKRYLTLLVTDGYIRLEIRNENKRKFYVTTGKGLALLHAYGRVIELFQYEGLHQIAADLL